MLPLTCPIGSNWIQSTQRKQRKVTRWPHLTETQVAQFKEEGYLVVEDVLDPEQDLDPVIEEYAGVLDQLAQELYDNGEISSTVR